MTDDIIQEQIAYYRARASEYDEWVCRMGRYDHGDDLNRRWFKEVEAVIRALHAIGPVGRVLELAAGTGNWTQELLKIAQHVTAIDISPEMLEINRRKVKAPNVDFRVADLFAWEPDTAYDMACFGFWLSHVPHDRLDSFLDVVRRSVRPGGKLFMVDSLSDTSSTAHNHNPVEPESLYHTRKLNDGREFTVVKIFYTPDELRRLLERAGFDVTVSTTEHYFIYAQGLKRA